jgi:hypothetical protein
MEEMDFVDWINYGIDMGWCSHIVCETHDLVPLTKEEDELWESGDDPCCTIVRIW